MMRSRLAGWVLPLRWLVLAAVLTPGIVAGHAGPQTDATVSTEAQQAALPECSLAPGNPNKLAVEPCRRAPTKVKRRAVAQVIARMPVQRQPVQAPTYNMAARTVVPSYAPSPGGSGGPVPIMGCDPGGCRDASGVRYNSGAPNTALDPHGRPCSRNGPWLQCF